ncbi:putative reverse transcriptase domain-containing protein [Tanacetum coccineum]|uniref:Reverse transcriptase domain-containing protein n=1 Tax=Tanacetum coccineum TaxID=301880 RepID=A0ABQ5GM61_9ASTR
MAPKRISTTATTTATPMTDAQLKALIAQGVADVLAERDATKAEMAKIAMIQEQVLEGQNELLESAPTVTSSNINPWTSRVLKELWFLCSGSKRWKLYSISATIQSHVKSSLQPVLYKELLLRGGNPTMFPEELNEIKKYVGGLPDMIHGSVMASKPKTMQEAIEFATELMDKNISTLAERVAIAYTAGSGERKEYARTLLLCNKCKFHHNGQCIIKCANYKRVGHLTRDCRSPTTINNQRNLTCYECGNQGHYRSDCPELKNQNHGNQAGGTEARGMVYALGGETNQDL